MSHVSGGVCLSRHVTVTTTATVITTAATIIMHEIDTPLMHAVRSGAAAKVEELLSNGAEADAPRTDASNVTPLVVACAEGHESVVRLLLKHGASVIRSILTGATPLLMASQQGHKLVVKLLLERGAAVNKAMYNGISPLIIASMQGHESVVMLLLEHAATVDQADSDGATALSMATESGHKSIVRLLLEYGAGPNRADHGGWTPLCFASQEGHEGIARLLLQHGAEVDQVTAEGATSLFLASQYGHKSIARLLLERGASVDAQASNTEVAPMRIACEDGHLEIVQLLSAYGANRTWDDDLTAENWGGGLTAESAAICFGHDHIAAWLIATRHCSTPLHYPTVISPDRTRNLLRDGADVFAASHAGGPTPLSISLSMLGAGNAADGSAAHLILRAAQAWCPATHELFPAEVRERARCIMRPLMLLAWKHLSPGMAAVDFMQCVLQFAVLRA